MRSFSIATALVILSSSSYAQSLRLRLPDEPAPKLATTPYALTPSTVESAEVARSMDTERPRRALVLLHVGLALALLGTLGAWAFVTY